MDVEIGSLSESQLLDKFDRRDVKRLLISPVRPVLDGERERDDREPERDERDALHCSIPLKITLVVIFLARNPLSNTGIANSGSHSPQV
mgnify:CR=1 FL=1